MISANPDQAGAQPAAFAARFGRRLALPIIAAPMYRVSGPELVAACCRAGIIGAFPTVNCRAVEELDTWLSQLRAELGPRDAPFAPNLIMKSEDLDDHLRLLIKHRVEIVITSVGSPAAAVEVLHDAGCMVIADVASLHHAHRAVEAGADGLILLSAGAGGQTGWANPFAFVRAVRAFYDGPVVLAGGIADGKALRAAITLGSDLAYMGTRFIGTAESRASEGYKSMLTACELDDVLLTRAFTGLETNMLRPSIVAAGLDPAKLPSGMADDGAAFLYTPTATEPRRWKDLWGAGHSVSGVRDVPTVADLVTRLRSEFRAAAEWEAAAISARASEEPSRAMLQGALTLRDGSWS